MSRRQLNDVERKLHQYALGRPNQVVGQKELETLVSDAKTRLASVNFLLGTGLFVVLESRGEALSYRAVSQSEVDLKKSLSAEEGLVLDRIRAAGNEGVWTKHIKAKTQLHQTIVDKCLKSLTQKQLIKTVTDVRHSTRKIYMLSNIQPSVELSGGPWYTDKELDTEFIKLLADVCSKIVQDRSMPKAKSDDNGAIRRLYPLSHNSYPTAEQILNLLNKSHITDTVLTVEHVEMLLQVLILDGKIEKLPAFSTTFGDTIQDSEHESDDLSENSQLRSRQSKMTSWKRKRDETLNDGSDQDEQSRRRGDHRPSGTSSRRGRKGVRSHRDSTDSNDGNTTDEDEKRHHKRSRRQSSSRERRKGFKGKARRRDSSPINSSESESETEASLSSDDLSRSRDRNPDDKSIVSRGETKERHRRREVHASAVSMSTTIGESTTMGGSVYRAVHEERIRGLGLDQAICVRCPTFDFCKPAGPVNPQECIYHARWLSLGEAA